MGNIIKLSISDLEIWTDNPRHYSITSHKTFTENQIINVLIEIVGETKMFNLTKDIIEDSGLMGNVFPTVVKKDDKYLVYDGNRRISCLKMIQNPEIIQDIKLKQKILKLTESVDLEVFKNIFVYSTTEDDALKLMDKTHSGEMDGIGVIPWDAFQRDISFSKRGKEPIYNYSYKVANLLGWNKKSDFLIQYTDLNRLFNSRYLRNHFDIDDEISSNQVIKVQSLIDKLLHYKKVKSFKSFSREFNITSTDEKMFEKPIITFCNWVDELNKNALIYEVKGDDISIFQDDTFDISLCNITIYNKNNKEIISDTQNISYDYINPLGKKQKVIETNIIGKWKIEVTYLDATTIIVVDVRQLLHPKLKLKKTINVNFGSSYNITDAVILATDSHDNDMSDMIRIHPYDDCFIDKCIFSHENKEGSYTIGVQFDDRGSKISDTLQIIVSPLPKNRLSAKKLDGSLFTIDEERIISISKIANDLINEINDLDLNEFPCVITSSVRSLFEISFDELNKKKIIQLYDNQSEKKSSSLKDKFDKLLVVISNKNTLSQVCKILNISYQNEENCLQTIDTQNISSILNISAHKSCMDIDMIDFREKSKLMTKLLLYISALLSLSS